MINPENNSIQRKDGVSPGRETSDVNRVRKSPNARKDFSDILEGRDEDPDDLKTGSNKKNATDEDMSLMSLFSKPPAKPQKSSQLLDEIMVDHKTLNESGSQIVDTRSKTKLKSAKEENSEIDGLAKKGQFNAQYTEERPDISHLNPNATVNEINLAAGSKVEQTAPAVSPIHDIVAELIEKLTILQTKGQTDTVVTLNTPGMFKGAIVVMSQFETANGQLNLSFENLTAQAKNLLDSLGSRESLMVALSEKGYVVQMITTTTLIEHKPIITAGSPESQFGKQQSQEDDSDKKDKR